MIKTPWEEEKKGTGGGDGKLDATNEFDRVEGKGVPHMGKSLIRVLREQALVRVSDLFVRLEDGQKDIGVVWMAEERYILACVPGGQSSLSPLISTRTSNARGKKAFQAIDAKAGDERLGACRRNWWAESDGLIDRQTLCFKDLTSSYHFVCFAPASLIFRVS